MKVLPSYAGLLSYKNQLLTIRSEDEITLIDPNTGKMNKIGRIYPSNLWPSWFAAIPNEVDTDEAAGLLFVKYLPEQNSGGALFDTVATINIQTGKVLSSPNIKLYETSETPSNTFSTGLFNLK